jgi:amino acid transporter
VKSKLTKKTARKKVTTGHGFGTSAVFLTSICTILGAIMFLRFGYAVGSLGLIGALAIIILGHLITIPTGLAVSEIATNLKVGGGGEYFIISRSFGSRIGASIGVMLYSARVISIAFYVIAFAEIFNSDFFAPFVSNFESFTGLTFDIRMISLPAMLILLGLILTRGANIGVKALWGIFGLLIIAVAMFLIGGAVNGASKPDLTTHVSSPDSFATVFAITFPAFTGMIAGVGLSGDLKDPRKSIPNGTLLAILVGLIIYILIVIKLYFSASAADLANDQFIMYDISSWGPIILLALVAATISSAIGSILTAPRILQAFGNDKIFPKKEINDVVKEGQGENNEPINATIISGLIAIVFVLVGDLNAVASVITMFFLITYGTICLISFLEHFAGNPSYRPTFRTKWYLSFMGTVLCFGIMFQINLIYAIIAIVIMILIYYSLRTTHKKSRSFAVIFQGVMFQIGRWMKLELQKSGSKPDQYNWRPSVVAISTHSVERSAPKDLLRWISHFYGFGTLIHVIKGHLNEKAVKNSQRVKRVLINQINKSGANYTVNTLISPSLITSVSQTVQISGISGLDNNTILFEFNRNRHDELSEIVEGCKIAETIKFNSCILRATEHNFGNHQTIHIWITDHDFKNANLMILLSYIIIEHPDWEDAEVKIYTAFPRGEEKIQANRIKTLISKGRLPISVENVKSFSYKNRIYFEKLVRRKSKKADLVILGFTPEHLGIMGEEVFKKHPKLQETLFVMAGEDIYIT